MVHKQVFRFALGLGCAVVAPQAGAAAGPIDACRAIADPTERLACYDRLATQARATDPTPPATSATPQERATFQQHDARNAPSASKPTHDLKHRTDFDSRIAAVRPLRHGYHRLDLEDGSAYETTIVGRPPAVGTEVHVRRTFVGTTYLDMKGTSPIPIRLARRQ